LRNRLEDARR